LSTQPPGGAITGNCIEDAKINRAKIIGSV
jgi:hypothetical protein